MSKKEWKKDKSNYEAYRTICPLPKNVLKEYTQNQNIQQEQVEQMSNPKSTSKRYVFLLLCIVAIGMIFYILQNDRDNQAASDTRWKENVLMEDMPSRDALVFGENGKYPVFDSETGICRGMITSIIFLDTLEHTPQDSWDVSQEKNGKVLAWVEKNKDKYDLYIAADGGINAKYCNGLFADYNCLESIEFNDCFFTEDATDMSYMFYGDNLLVTLDVTGFDTGKVTDMQFMFSGCSSLTKLDVSVFDTSQVTNMSAMFNFGDAPLTELDVSEFDTSQVTDMSGMFSSCSDTLTKLDVSQFDTSKVTDMSNMFLGCTSLTKLDVNGFDTSQVTTMYGMFYGCASLIKLDVSRFDTSQVTDMSGMFAGCWSLKKLDVAQWNTENVTNMEGLFYQCAELETLDIRNWNMDNVTNTQNMFFVCEKLPEEIKNMIE